MQRILVVEDETIVQKFLNEIAEENIVRISSNDENLIQYDDIILNVDSYEVLKNNEKIELTMREYQILKLLMENPNKVFSREKLLNNIWKYDNWVDENVINTHISNIRKKLNCNCIETIRSIGYKLVSNN